MGTASSASSFGSRLALATGSARRSSASELGEGEAEAAAAALALAFFADDESGGIGKAVFFLLSFDASSSVDGNELSNTF